MLTSGCPIIDPKERYTNVRNLPLLSAAINRRASIDIIRALIAGGADLNQKALWVGWTPLMVAAYCGYTDAVEALLKAGADASLENKEDGYRTPLDYATDGEHKDIIQMLQR